MTSSYQPFLISEFKTGLFNYLQPWIRPIDAFDPLQNAFIYRGVVQKRKGYYPLGRIASSFTDVEIALGTGITNYSGTLDDISIVPGTFTATDGIENFTDNGFGVLTGDAGGSGTIVYSTGAWSLNFNAAVTTGTPILADYSCYSGRFAYRDNGINIKVGTGVVTYTGTLATFPIRPGSFFATDGVEAFTDNGNGTLTGDAGGTGTIQYNTGAWSLTFNMAVIAGVIIRASYTFIPTQTSTPSPLSNPIMGLKQWISEATGDSKLLALDTKRAALYNDSTQQFDPISSINQVLWVDDGTTASITISTGWTGLAPYSVTVSYPGQSMTDDGVGGFPGAGVMLNTSTVNYSTGAIHLDLSANVAGRTFTATFNLSGNYFTGNNSNFFNATNWIGPTYVSSNPGFLYLTNNVDRITLFDGTNLSRPPFPITSAHNVTFTNDITTCLDLDVYKNRLLVQRPKLVGNSQADSQSIRWSAVNAPTNLVADVTGNGGESSAPTDDFIQSSEFLRDQLIVFFTNSTYTFRFTGNSFDPFRWDKINVTKSTNAPYGTVPYDERVTAMGSKGLSACDGVNMQRYDINIIDQFLDINQNLFNFAYGVRFDTDNHTWMLYPSISTGATTSDRVLIFNFVEQTWAVYDISLSCLGIHYISTDVTWNDFALGRPVGNEFPSWNVADIPWNYYLLQDRAPSLIGGDHTGIVYVMNGGTTDDGATITANITSTKWNPFSQLGQKVQFGYVDFYYDVDDDCDCTVNFYVNNSEAPALTRNFTLTSPNANQTSALKRVFVNLVGEFLQMELITSSDADLKILGMVLWASPSGRWIIR